MTTILIMLSLLWLYRVQLVGTNWLGFRTFKPEMISFKDNSGKWELKQYGETKIQNNGMNYFEAMESTITKEDALKEIRKHFTGDALTSNACLNVEEFLEDVGDKENYKGSEVLDWLGY